VAAGPPVEPHPAETPPPHQSAGVFCTVNRPDPSFGGHGGEPFRRLAARSSSAPCGHDDGVVRTVARSLTTAVILIDDKTQSNTVIHIAGAD
jgi:hypothetical protein